MSLGPTSSNHVHGMNQPSQPVAFPPGYGFRQPQAPCPPSPVDQSIGPYSTLPLQPYQAGPIDYTGVAFPQASAPLQVSTGQPPCSVVTPQQLFLQQPEAFPQSQFEWPQQHFQPSFQTHGIPTDHSQGAPLQAAFQPHAFARLDGLQHGFMPSLAPVQQSVDSFAQIYQQQELDLYQGMPPQFNNAFQQQDLDLSQGMPPPQFNNAFQQPVAPNGTISAMTFPMQPPTAFPDQHAAAPFGPTLPVLPVGQQPNGPPTTFMAPLDATLQTDIPQLDKDSPEAAALESLLKDVASLRRLEAQCTKTFPTTLARAIMQANRPKPDHEQLALERVAYVKPASLLMNAAAVLLFRWLSDTKRRTRQTNRYFVPLQGLSAAGRSPGVIGNASTFINDAKAHCEARRLIITQLQAFAEALSDRISPEVPGDVFEAPVGRFGNNSAAPISTKTARISIPTFCTYMAACARGRVVEGYSVLPVSKTDGPLPADTMIQQFKLAHGVSDVMLERCVLGQASLEGFAHDLALEHYEVLDENPFETVDWATSRACKSVVEKYVPRVMYGSLW